MLTNQKILKAKDDTAVIHAVGPGYGESIILTLGGCLVLGIDCCEPLVQTNLKGTSYLQRVLARCVKNPHIVWVLTHFHWDHFQSFTKLLYQVGPRLARIVVPGDYLSADLQYLAHEAQVDAGLPTYHLAKDELRRLRHELSSPPLSKIVNVVSGTNPLPLFHPIAGIRASYTVPLFAEVTGPSRKTTEDLGIDAMDQIHAGKETRQRANETSYIVRVKAGRFESLFLGDSSISNSLAASVQSVSRDMFVLKVAHHGSLDGTDIKLLQHIGSKARKKVALICPFKVHKLPDPHVLRILKKHRFHTKVTAQKKSSIYLKKQMLSRTVLATGSSRLLIYPPESSVATIRSQI